MKARHVVLLILAITIADQVLKFYIKLNFYVGDEHRIIGNWFRLHFVENEGMAYGWQFGSGFGKIALTLFRLVAVVWGSFLLRDFIRKKYTTGFIVCAALIYAGALGNLIDSMFYGLIFEESRSALFGVGNVAHMVPWGKGYASFLHGKVVDMLYFPFIEDKHYPSWIPFVGGDKFTFFSFIFNIADASISMGVITLLLFQNKFLKHEKHTEPTPVTTEIIQELKEENN